MCPLDTKTFWKKTRLYLVLFLNKCQNFSVFPYTCHFNVWLISNTVHFVLYRHVCKLLPTTQQLHMLVTFDGGFTSMSNAYLSCVLYQTVYLNFVTYSLSLSLILLKYVHFNVILNLISTSIPHANNYAFWMRKTIGRKINWKSCLARLSVKLNSKEELQFVKSKGYFLLI